MKGWSLAVVNSHPIQYFAPLYRRLAAEDRVDLTVYYGSRAGLEAQPDPGFRREVEWDVPLLEGYEYEFLRNLWDTGQPDGFWSLVNPDIAPEIRRGGFDAVWLHGHNSATNLMAVAAALASSTPLFMRCETHLGLDRPPWKRHLRKPVMRAFYGLFEAFLAIGSRNANFYRAHGVDEEKLFLVPYTVDNRRFRAGAALDDTERARVRDELGLPALDAPVVLFVSKLITRKRPFDLLGAFRIVQDRIGGDAALVFVGDGEERERLEARTRNQNDVHILGFRNQSELPRIYGTCDLFVLPSENEPWGLVVNEAMAAGLPVIASDEVGAAADLVREGENGSIYPCGDVEALADRLTGLVTDPAVLDRMGRGSLRIIEDWDFERCAKGIRQALEGVCPASVKSGGGGPVA